MIVLSQYAEPGYVVALLEGGSARRGYLLKDRVSDKVQLIDAIERVAAGGSVVDPKVVETLVAAHAGKDRSPLDLLTPREHEILAEVAAGKSNTASAESDENAPTTGSRAGTRRRARRVQNSAIRTRPWST